MSDNFETDLATLTYWRKRSERAEEQVRVQNGYAMQQRLRAEKAEAERDAALADLERERPFVNAYRETREREARLRKALERIRGHIGIGRGAADIIVANAMLGRIDQEAREALELDA